MKWYNCNISILTSLKDSLDATTFVGDVLILVSLHYNMSCSMFYVLYFYILDNTKMNNQIYIIKPSNITNNNNVHTHLNRLCVHKA